MALTYNAIADASLTVGKPITDQIGTYLRDNWLATRKIAIASGDLTYTNDNTVNDTGMTLACVGGTRWIVRGVLYIVNVANDINLRINLTTTDPANDAGMVHLWQQEDTNNYFDRDALNTDLTIGLAAPAGTCSPTAIFEAYISFDATPAAASVTLYAAQSASNANSTSIKAGSYMYGLMMDNA